MASPSCLRVVRSGSTRLPRKSFWRTSGPRSVIGDAHLSTTFVVCLARPHSGSFLDKSAFDLLDIYARPGSSSTFTAARRAAGHLREVATIDEGSSTARRWADSFTSNDDERYERWRDLAGRLSDRPTVAPVDTPGRTSTADAVRAAWDSGVARSRKCRTAFDVALGVQITFATSSSSCWMCCARADFRRRQPIDPYRDPSRSTATRHTVATKS